MKKQKEVKLHLDHLECSSCVNHIEKHLQKMQGVDRVSVDLASKHVFVSFDTEKISKEKILQELRMIGYPEKKRQEEHNLKLAILTFLSLILAFPLVLEMIFQWTPFAFHMPLWIAACLATVVQFGGGYSFYVGTFYGLKQLRANMDTLVALGTSAAYGYSLYLWIVGAKHSYFETSSVLIAFILLGRYLEDYAKRRATKGMKALLEMQPKTALVLQNEKEIEIPIEEINKEDLVVVKVGDVFPVDGIIKKGHTEVDESMLTGESVPIEKTEGSQVFAGTINRSYVVRIQSEKSGSETKLGKIITLVQKAQASKAPLQKMADKIASVFVPCVLAISLLTFIVWYVLYAHLTEAILHAVATLVIACPCALGLATPLVIVVATHIGTKKGILIKDADALQKVKQIHALLLDKTGTVTTSTMKIEEIRPVVEEEKALPILATLATYSNHPLSQAIHQYLLEKNIEPLEPKAHETLPGKGVSIQLDDQTYYLGSIKLFETIEEELEQDKMMSFFGTKEKLFGVVIFSDAIQEGVKEVIAKLKEMGIQIFLISGDRKPSVKRVADFLQIEHFFAEVLPEDKVACVQKVQKEGKIVGMVGDGINDAPALEHADIGFAVSSGTDIAMEHAAIGLMRPGISGIWDAICLSKKTVKKIYQNLFFAFIYNVIGIPLAAFGFLTPILAGIAMALSSLSVVLNSLSLRSHN